MLEPDHEAPMPFVAPVRLRNGLWIVVLAGAWLAVTLLGTPHLRVSYRWNGSDRSPVYFACTYWGLASFRTVPADGRCPLVVLARPRREG